MNTGTTLNWRECQDDIAELKRKIADGNEYLLTLFLGGEDEDLAYGVIDDVRRLDRKLWKRHLSARYIVERSLPVPDFDLDHGTIY